MTDSNLPPSGSENPQPLPRPSDHFTPTHTKKPMGPLAIVLLLSGGFFLFFLIVSMALFWRGGSDGMSRPASRAASLFKKGGVAVIEINGIIMDSKRTLKKLERAEEDPDVAAVVVRINSPGGAVGPSQEIYDAVKRLKKPVVASMGSLAASGGFYVAVAAKKIYANPGTITGSIGVIMEFLNLEKLYEWAKVKRYSIKTGKFKDVGADYHEMSPEGRALLQGMVDDVLVQFKEAVATGRKMTFEQVTAIADGRIFSGSQAKKIHLVDELGGLQDAINDAAKMAGLKGKPRVIYPEPPHKSIVDYLMEGSRGGGDDEDSETDIAGAKLVSRLVDAVATRLTGVDAASTHSAALTPGIYWLWNGAN